MTVLNMIQAIIGFIGLYTWFGTKKQMQIEGVWHNEKTGAFLWLIIWVAILFLGIYFL